MILFLDDDDDKVFEFLMSTNNGEVSILR